MAQANPEGFQYKFIESATDGLRKDMRSDAMPDGASTIAKNVTLRDGIMSVDKGYQEFLGTFRGTPQAIIDVDYVNDTSDLILVTTDTVYERISGEWNYAINAMDKTNVVVTSASADAASAQKDIVVTSATGFSQGDHIGVRYKLSSQKVIYSTTKGATTTYVLTGEIPYVVGNIVNVTGYALSTYNVTQTILTSSYDADNVRTTITTDLNSSGFANTTATNPKIERTDQTIEFRTTIANISSTTFTLAEDLPGRVLKGARVVKAVSLSGDLDYIPDYVFVPSWSAEINPSNGSPVTAIVPGTVVYTNNIDAPLLFMKSSNGVAVREIDLTNIRISPYTNAASAISNFRAKTVELFNEKLCFGKTYESGVNYTNRLRMSKAGTFEDFRSDSGGEVYDLLEGDSNIQAIKRLRNLLIVYKRRSIIRGDWVGSVDVSTRFQTTIANEGAISTAGVVLAEGKHYVVGTKNIYEYDGGPELTPIGDPIREDLFVPTRFANINFKEFIQLAYDPEYRELHLFYPEGTVKGVRKSFRYHEQYKAWTARNYTHYFTTFNMIKSVETLTWNDLRANWSLYNQPWTSAFYVSEKLHRFFLGQGKLLTADGRVLPSPVQVWDQNQIRKTEDTYTVYWQFDTKDFYLPNNFIRVDFLDVYASGDDVSLWWSADLGDQWTRVRALDPRDNIESERVYLNRTAKRIRYRLKGGGTNFQLGWFGFNYIPEFSW
tara:strand:+ start:1334 stop:3490 length:2157 start_codon:yes stop_codon:yes gene_type:complete